MGLLGLQVELADRAKSNWVTVVRIGKMLLLAWEGRGRCVLQAQKKAPHAFACEAS